MSKTEKAELRKRFEDCKEKLIKRLGCSEVIRYENVNLKSAGPSDVYFNIKSVLGESEILNDLSDYLYSMFPEKTNFVCGEGFGGIPLATTICSRHDLKMVSIRKEEKDYGLKNRIEYCPPTKKDNTAIVDDVLSTGGSLKSIISLLEGYTNIVGYYVVVNREDTEKIPEYSEGKLCGYTLEYLFKSGELLI
jgi:orotate phosphoribosyltransferase